MNKFRLSILALAALSSAAFADQKRSYDLRDIQPFKSHSVTVYPKVVTKTSPLAVIDHGSLTNFQKLRLKQQNDTSGDGGLNN